VFLFFSDTIPRALGDIPKMFVYRNFGAYRLELAQQIRFNIYIYICVCVCVCVKLDVTCNYFI
jgi:hypothetical protein